MLEFEATVVVVVVPSSMVVVGVGWKQCLIKNFYGVFWGDKLSCRLDWPLDALQHIPFFKDHSILSNVAETRHGSKGCLCDWGDFVYYFHQSLNFLLLLRLSRNYGLQRGTELFNCCPLLSLLLLLFSSSQVETIRRYFTSASLLIWSNRHWFP